MTRPDKTINYLDLRGPHNYLARTVDGKVFTIPINKCNGLQPELGQSIHAFPHKEVQSFNETD